MSGQIHAAKGRPFVFLHVGDLHLAGAGQRNHLDLREILTEIEELPPGAFDFVYVPGDIAEDGLAAQYRLLTGELALRNPMPIRLIPGDHDRQYGHMADFDTFYAGVMEPTHPASRSHVHGLPTGPGPAPVVRVTQSFYREDFGAVRCLFLDMVSAGFGQKGRGLDFRLGKRQMSWLSRKVRRARCAGKTVAVFMHSYPADLEKKEADAVAGLFWSEGVRLVEMGHTHYNEIAHDGRTTYAAARSVGQNEDGSVGYAVCAIDGDAVSWRFKPLDRTWPFVVITSPVDRRLSTEALALGHDGLLPVRAVVLSDKPPSKCRCRVDDGPWHTMRACGGGAYAAAIPWPQGSQRITVEAIHPDRIAPGPDFIDRDVIEPPGLGFYRPDPPEHPGSDRCAVGRWLEKGVRGDQLGPNRAGREW